MSDFFFTNDLAADAPTSDKRKRDTADVDGSASGFKQGQSHRGFRHISEYDRMTTSEEGKVAWVACTSCITSNTTCHIWADDSKLHTICAKCRQDGKIRCDAKSSQDEVHRAAIAAAIDPRSAFAPRPILTPFRPSTARKSTGAKAPPRSTAHGNVSSSIGLGYDPSASFARAAQVPPTFGLAAPAYTATPTRASAQHVLPSPCQGPVYLSYATNTPS